MSQNKSLKLRKLICFSVLPAADHIGIISPYNAQVGKIRNVISKIAKDIKVGSVEEFQGQVCSSNYLTFIIGCLLI